MMMPLPGEHFRFLEVNDLPQECFICYTGAGAWKLGDHNDVRLCQECTDKLLAQPHPMCPLCRANLVTGESAQVSEQVSLTPDQLALYMPDVVLDQNHGDFANSDDDYVINDNTNASYGSGFA
ncbi:hypothetical protein, partial [Streptomyces wuyuanensis]|uniref:hypothetical protein n=1 Tax=Streptomyces wuyuanensis TaxID=1196353 RepID=UPI0034247F55